jgi:alpha-N-arabinofuranosidase
MKIWFTCCLTILSLVCTLVAAPVEFTVHTDQITKTINTGIYGQFLEHIFNSVHGGIWGDQILNGTLEPRSAFGGRGGRQGGEGTNAPGATPANIPPSYWEFVGGAGGVSIDPNKPFNADVSVHVEAKADGDVNAAPGIRQRNIFLKDHEKYTLSLYARGIGSVVVTFRDSDTVVFTKTVIGLTDQWQKFTVKFTSPRTVNAASLVIGVPGSAQSSVNFDQISLFSASALATGGYRPDLLKAVADLQPASIRWPGGSFASRYVWQNGIGPREKRLPHPAAQWNDRDTYQFGTDEFMQLCERVKADPVIVINTRRGVQDALNWLEYCMGDTTTEFGKLRAANGHRATYQLKTVEIDNETWNMRTSGYLNVISNFCPAIRAKFPCLKLSVCGSYGYDNGRGENNQTNWDGQILEAGKLFDILSPHYYNGIYTTADYVEDPRKYEQFLQGRGELIRNSANPNVKIYVSEWNLTNNRWTNDWRTGLYAGGILNGFERQSDIVTMTCPALFLRKQGVTTDWNNALVNFDQKSWFPGPSYVTMKLWRDSFAPNLLAVDGPDHPLNFVATRSTDKRTVFLKAVNPTTNTVETIVHLDGGMEPRKAAMQLIAPGAETVKNSLEQPNNIKATPATATIENSAVKFNMPPLSAGVVRITR